jgi:hypothetical protein
VTAGRSDRPQSGDPAAVDAKPSEPSRFSRGRALLPASVCFALFGAGKSKKPPAAGWLTRGSDATISAAMLPPLQLQAKK